MCDSIHVTIIVYFRFFVLKTRKKRFTQRVGNLFYKMLHINFCHRIREINSLHHKSIKHCLKYKTVSFVCTKIKVLNVSTSFFHTFYVYAIFVLTLKLKHFALSCQLICMFTAQIIRLVQYFIYKFLLKNWCIWYILIWSARLIRPSIISQEYRV